MVVCTVGNRGGGRAAMFAGLGGKCFGWLLGPGRRMDHPLARNLRACGYISKCEPFSVLALPGTGVAA